MRVFSLNWKIHSLLILSKILLNEAPAASLEIPSTDWLALDFQSAKSASFFLFEFSFLLSLERFLNGIG